MFSVAIHKNDTPSILATAVNSLDEFSLQIASSNIVLVISGVCFNVMINDSESGISQFESTVIVIVYSP